MILPMNFVQGSLESDFEVCTYFACMQAISRLICTIKVFMTLGVICSTLTAKFLFFVITCFLFVCICWKDNLFSPYQCLYDFWRLWFDFHFDILLLQFCRLVRRVQPCFVDGVSGCARGQDWVASTFFGFTNLAFSFLRFLPFSPGHALHSAVLKEGGEATAEAVRDQVRHQTSGLAHFSVFLLFCISVFLFLYFCFSVLQQLGQYNIKSAIRHPDWSIFFCISLFLHFCVSVFQQQRQKEMTSAHHLCVSVFQQHWQLEMSSSIR